MHLVLRVYTPGFKPYESDIRSYAWKDPYVTRLIFQAYKSARLLVNAYEIKSYAYETLNTQIYTFKQ